MRKSTIFVTMLVVFSVLLAACNTAQGNTGTGTPASGTETGGLSGTETVAPTTGGQTGTTETVAPTMGTTSTVAGTQMTTETSPTTVASNQAEDPSLLSNEMKFQLLDSNNQPLGQVKDFILDLTNLKVAYLIVSLTQASSTSSTEVAVPWSKVKVQAASSTNMSSTAMPTTDTTTTPAATTASSATQASGSQSTFVYTGDQQMLMNAPAFDATTLPQLGQPAANWDAAWVSYWSGAGGAAATGTVMTTPTVSATAAAATETPTTSSTTAAASPLAGVALASKVISFGVMDSTNQSVATVTDLVVDVNTGNLTYVILTVNGKLIPLPLQALGMNMQNQALVIVVPTQVLSGAPSFDPGSFPDATMSGWDAQIQSYWNTQVTPAATETATP